jgi:hypothetical protein
MKFMNKTGRASLLVIMCVLTFGIPDAKALTIGNLDVYGLMESFTWREFDDAGVQLLKESGPRLGVGVAFAHEFTNRLTLRPRAELNGGDVDYNGQTQTGVPVTSTTTYFGFKFEMDMGDRVPLWQGAVLEPFIGFGARTWYRDISDSAAADGSRAVGYMERWKTFNGRLGIRGEQSFGQKNNLFLLAGVKLPVSTENYINDAAISSQAITLKPGNKPSLFAEAGVQLDSLRFSAFYDTMRFKKSPVVWTSATSGFLQPRSESDMLGVRIGGSF